MKREWFFIDYSDDDYTACYFDGLDTEGAGIIIMDAAASKGPKKLERILQVEREYKVISDFANGRGMTPLMAAAINGHADIVAHISRQTLTHINRQDERGMTALHYAAKYGEADIAKILLKHKANPSLENKKGETAFDLAVDEDMRDALNTCTHITRLRGSYTKAAAKAPAPEAEPTDAEKSTYLRGTFLPLSSCNTNTFAELCQQKRDVLAKDIWNDMFLQLAEAGRGDLLKTWHAERALPSKKIIDQALLLAATKSDNPSAMRELMWMGANPFYKAKGSDCAALAAVAHGKTGHFREMAFLLKYKTSTDTLALIEGAVNKYPSTDPRYGEMRQSLEDMRIRVLDISTLSSNILRNFRSAMNDKHLETAFFLYLKGLDKSFFKGAVNWRENPVRMQSLLLRAYMADRLDMVDAIERGGHSLKGAHLHPDYQTMRNNQDRYAHFEHVRKLVNGEIGAEAFRTYEQKEADILKQVAVKHGALVQNYSGRRFI